MKRASVLVLYNEPLLPADHPDAFQEHIVLHVAAAVAKSLKAEGFRASLMALGADPTVLWKTLQRRRPNVVFNLFEGTLDQPDTESYVTGLLEWARVPYTGSPFATLTLARIKHIVKRLLQGAGLPTARFEVIHQLPAPRCKLQYPVFVKPATLDASLGIDQQSVCASASALAKRVRYLADRYGLPILVEEYIPGREFNVSILELPALQALPPVEIMFPAKKDRWPILTYTAKWQMEELEADLTTSRFPADVPAALERQLSDLALRAFRLLDCRDYARVDFRVTPDGQPYILEVNPNPDISPEADLTRCLSAISLSHSTFLARLVRQALKRRQ